MNDHEPGRESTVSTWRAVLVTALLALSFSFSFLDRQVLPLLLEPVRHTFAISDTQIGLLQGLAFSTFYACAGIPLGWMVDRFHRVRIAAACVAAWGLATAACGLCSSFVQLLAARTATAVGEAGCSPASWSILSDLLTGRALLRATAVYNTGPYIGGGMALILGSIALRYFTGLGGPALPLFGHVAPWQAVFVVVGLPGLLLGGLILMLREPARRVPEVQHTDISTRATLKVLLGSPQLMFYFAGFLFVTSGFYVLVTWFPSVMIREGFGTVSTVGRPLGTVFLSVGLTGCLLSQLLVRKLDNRELLGALLRRLSIVLSIQIPIIAMFPMVGTAASAYWFYGCEVATFSIVTTFMSSPIQLAVPNRMRGRATGLFLVSNNVLGASLGPSAVGALSDRLKGHPHGLAVAFAIVLAVSSICSVILIYLSSSRRSVAGAVDALQTSAMHNNS
ncbi:MFS transporter [Paraburkholderia lycopersici]|uniref:Predicted arabinose efflux permease, MFS family n=1 Tax=Paraburkholderia lycopersici TaxID=416944 RepID=A0A1G6PH87_9BURK|nr:MFS transporter [Paraburkholderia lycopersici]SDC79600.1 Predicted arabinose efflux permease, MFS family [Paraburkholderia lycopersici]